MHATEEDRRLLGDELVYIGVDVGYSRNDIAFAEARIDGSPTLVSLDDFAADGVIVVFAVFEDGCEAPWIVIGLRIGVVLNEFIGEFGIREPFEAAVLLEPKRFNDLGLVHVYLPGQVPVKFVDEAPAEVAVAVLVLVDAGFVELDFVRFIEFRFYKQTIAPNRK